MRHGHNKELTFVNSFWKEYLWKVQIFIMIVLYFAQENNMKPIDNKELKADLRATLLCTLEFEPQFNFKMQIAILLWDHYWQYRWDFTGGKYIL